MFSPSAAAFQCYPGTHAPRVWLELDVLLQSVTGELKAMCAAVLSEGLQLEVGRAGSVCVAPPWIILGTFHCPLFGDANSCKGLMCGPSVVQSSPGSEGDCFQEPPQIPKSVDAQALVGNGVVFACDLRTCARAL